MKNIDIPQIVSILANVGVIASIVFLGLEVRNSSTQAQIATTQEVVAQRSDWRELLAADGELADIYMRGLQDFRGLSPLEQERFDLLMRSFLHKISVAITARSAELLRGYPDPSRRVIEGELARLLDEPGFRQWWAIVDRRAIVDGVATMIDELSSQRDAPTDTP